MIYIRILLVLLMYVLSGYGVMVESAEYARKQSNPRNMLRHTKEIVFLNNNDIAQRTKQDIRWHNRRELAYHTRREARVRNQRMYK